SQPSIPCPGTRERACEREGACSRARSRRPAELENSEALCEAPALEDTSREKVLLRSVARRGFFAAEFLGQDDGFGQFLHGAAQAAAFVAHPQIRLFLGQALPALKDALGALDDLTGLQLTFDLGGFLS